MALLIGEQSTELLQAQAHVWNHIFNYVNSMSLKCATQLGIPDIIHRHGKPMTLEELVDALHINSAKAQAVYRLMRILTHLGFFVEEKVSEDDSNVGYWLTQASRLLLKDDALSALPFLQVALDPLLIKPWHHMSEWFENNEDSSAFETAYGKTFWDYGSQEPKMNLPFNKAMASDTQLVSNVVTRDCKQVFEKLKSIVDVGGGTGSLAKAIVDSFPDLHCVVFDLPHVIAGLEGTKNLTYVGGNMFETIPRADALLLKCILHDWSDEDCVKILKKCREAIPCKENGGKVIIIDIIVGNKKEDHKGIETQLFYDMSMMVWANGRERTEKEWAKLFIDAGFTRYNIVYGLGLRSIIEVYP
ncbi:trans-resveratrol di-O-methyltransferase-like [Olea europaea subsp. europaea]|uniref:Trans-resveratrol di-O-methyltransferase-like n=1 Tax=Olea europaea subsp. europaea TaxID=158383 RepID=A0A8S0S706_OLEEU|nr:trans-resveratrol di-O-methyltransferase-like [Olea europaea subsp. europaea]